MPVATGDDHFCIFIIIQVIRQVDHLSRLPYFSFSLLFSPKECQSQPEARRPRTTCYNTRKMHLQETNKKRNQEIRTLTAYLSISTARELSLTLISVVGWARSFCRTHAVSVRPRWTPRFSHSTFLLVFPLRVPAHPVPSTSSLPLSSPDQTLCHQFLWALLPPPLCRSRSYKLLY